jgi:hypothetical protein
MWQPAVAGINQRDAKSWLPRQRCRRPTRCRALTPTAADAAPSHSLFGWLVAGGWCWFVLREEYYWLVVGGWFVLREKYCWLMADKPSEQGRRRRRRLLGPSSHSEASGHCGGRRSTWLWRKRRRSALVDTTEEETTDVAASWRTRRRRR